MGHFYMSGIRVIDYFLSAWKHQRGAIPECEAFLAPTRVPAGTGATGAMSRDP